MKTDTRKQVEAEIIRVMAEAQARGEGDGFAAAQRAFPSAPESVLWECWSELDSQQTVAWWQTIERTIDGEVIRNSLATTSRASS